MFSPHRLRLRRSLAVALTIGSVVLSMSAGSTYADGSINTATGGASVTGDVATPPQPAVGSDLTEFDTPSARFTELANGLIGVQLYDARVGINDPSGWRFRNPRLGNVGADGTVAPLDEPFALHIATTANNPSLATLTNEDNVSLGISGVTMNGTPIAAGTGIISGTEVQFPGTAPLGNAASLTAAATISGLDLRIQLQGPLQTGTMSVELNPAPGLTLAALADGSVVAKTVDTHYGDDGVTPYPVDNPHFEISASAEDGTGAAAPTDSGAGPTLQIATGPTGKPSVTFSVDPAWLGDPARVYPVQLSLRVDTALSLVDSGQTSSTTTCPGRTGQSTSVSRVGTLAGCSAATQVYFDTSQIPPRTNIRQATFQVASLSSLLASAIQVQDAGSGATAAALPASGAASTQVSGEASAPGMAQSTVLGWDATATVQQWVQHTSPNQGLRLSSSGPQVQVASLDLARSAPQLAPALNLVVDPNPVPLATESGPGNMNAPAVAGIGDGVPFIYGSAGDVRDCGQTDGHICTGPVTALAAVQGHPGSYCYGQSGLTCNGYGGSLFRIPVYLPCPGTGADWSGAYALMSAAYSRQLVPVVDFVSPQQLNNSCGSIVTPSQWFTLMQGFAQGAPSIPYVYFEIGNEEDLFKSDYGDYNQVFFAASAGLYWNLPAGSFHWYRILVGGMLKIYGAGPGCSANTLDSANSWVAYTYGHKYPGYPRPIRTVVGIAVHPYGYTASDTPFINSAPGATNYGSFIGKTFGANGCSGIDAVVKYANSASVPSLNNLPIIISEVNASVNRWPPSDQNDITNQNKLNAAYLTDLFSYLYDRCGFATFGCTTGPIIPANSPLRVLWFRGNDENESLGYDAMGIYDTSGNDKLVPALNKCPGQKTSPTGQSVAHTYYYLRNGNCW